MAILYKSIVAAILVMAAAREPPRELDLGRLPQLYRPHPSLPSVKTLATSLRGKGVTPGKNNLTRISRLHVPHRDALQSAAFHDGVGYVAVNYTAQLAQELVHLDEFLSLFVEQNATWACSQSASEGGAGSVNASAAVGSLLTFKMPAAADEATRNATAVVLMYFLARLSAPGALLSWGTALLDRDGVVPLWDSSCDGPLVNRSTAPYFRVAHVELRNGTDGTFAIALALVPAPLMAMFSHIVHSYRFDPNMNRALAQRVAPFFFANGTELDQWRLHQSPSTARSLLDASIDPTLTGTGNQVIQPYSAWSWNWNYAGPGVATVSP
jgi:hypothetical protein